MKHTKAESSLSSEVFGEWQSYHTASDSSDDDLYVKKRKYKPYEEISGEFKKIKPPTFNGETEKGEEAESWLSAMKITSQERLIFGGRTWRELRV